MRRWALPLGLSVMLGSGCGGVLSEAGGPSTPRARVGANHWESARDGRGPDGRYLPCTSPREPLNFPTYWAESSFDGLALSAVIRQCAIPYPGEPIRVNSVSYLYGTCDPGPDAGCGVPLTVETYPAVERNKSSIDPEPPGAKRVRRTDTTVSGAPASWYGHGERLEIYRHFATIVIHGDDPSRMERFAVALVRAPDVLTDLAAYGYEFDAECVDDRHYCTAG